MVLYKSKKTIRNTEVSRMAGIQNSIDFNLLVVMCQPDKQMSLHS